MSEKIKRKNKWLTVIAAVFGIVTVLGVVAGGMGILNIDKDKAEETFLPSISESNYYSTAEVTIKDMNDGNGVKVTVNDKTGAITLNGKAEESLTYNVGTVELDKGEYTLTAINVASKNTVYLTATSGETTYNFDFVPGNTIEIDADGTVFTLKLHIAEGADLSNVKVLPTIVSGDTAGDFYR